MSCIHKFYAHPFHQQNSFGLFPIWKANTLIIGTFNPSNTYHSENDALYFYGRKKNYFWDVLPIFANELLLDKTNPEAQRQFLTANKIALTDLLISIIDADISNPEHIISIKSVRDKEIEKFSSFKWNTPNIISYIDANKIDQAWQILLK